MQCNRGFFAGMAFVGIFAFALAVMLLVSLDKDDDDDRGRLVVPQRGLAWWQTALIYHVYVASFYDSDANGYGDLRGESIESASSYDPPHSNSFSIVHLSLSHETIA